MTKLFLFAALLTLNSNAFAETASIRCEPDSQGRHSFSMDIKEDGSAQISVGFDSTFSPVIHSEEFDVPVKSVTSPSWNDVKFSGMGHSPKRHEFRVDIKKRVLESRKSGPVKADDTDFRILRSSDSWDNAKWALRPTPQGCQITFN